MKKLLIVLLILGLAAPAMASEVTFSGGTWVIFTWQSFDSDYNKALPANAYDESDFGGLDGVLQVPYGGKVNGINFMWKASDTLSGRVDLTQGEGEINGAKNIENAYVRHVLADWNFGAGHLKFGYGESETNVNFLAFPVTQAGGPWIGMGNVYPTRKSFVAAQFGGFTVDLRNNSGGAKGSFTDVDTIIPEVGASYVLANKLMFIKGAASFQTYGVKDHVADQDATINAYLASVVARFNIGMFNVGGLGYYAVNPLDAGIIAFASGAAGSASVAADGNVTDAISMGAAFAAGVSFTPQLSINTGISYQDSRMDTDGADGWHKTCAFLNVSTFIGPINFVPEVGYVDYGEHAGTDLGTELYVTTTFRVNW